MAVAQNCPSSEIEKMRFSATQAVYEYAEKFKITQITDSLKIQHKYVDTILRYLCAIYNSNDSVRDSVFKFYNFTLSQDFTNHSFINDFKTFLVYADSGAINIDTWKIKKSFGVKALDSFVKLHNLKFTLEYTDLLKIIGGDLKTDTWYYDYQLYAAFKQYIPSISINARGSTAGNLWFYRKNGDTTFFYFSHGWGDCFSGCINRRNWVIPVLSNFTVLPIRNVSRIAPYNLRLNIPGLLEFCDYQTPYVSYSKKTNTNYDKELGGNYGKWYINGKWVDDTSAIVFDSFGMHRIEHRPYSEYGVVVDQYVHVRKRSRLSLDKFFIRDSLVLCERTQFNWKNHITNFSLSNLITNKIKETIIKDEINKDYLPYIVEFKETRNNCYTYLDSMYIRRTEYAAHMVKDTYYLQYGDTIALQAANNTKWTFWEIGNYLKVGGEILKLPHPEWERDSTIRCNVRFANEYDCDTTIPFYIKFTGYKKDLGNRNFKKSIALIPNPANTHITIVNKDVLQISIYSMNGKKVLETSKKLIDITTLAEGVYIVAGKDIHNHTFTARLLVRRE